MGSLFVLARVLVRSILTNSQHGPDISLAESQRDIPSGICEIPRHLKWLRKKGEFHEIFRFGGGVADFFSIICAI